MTTAASNPLTKSWLIEALTVTTPIWDLMNEFISDAAVGGASIGALRAREFKE